MFLPQQQCDGLACKVEEFNVSMPQFVANECCGHPGESHQDHPQCVAADAGATVPSHHPQSLQSSCELLMDIKISHGVEEDIEAWRPNIDNFLDWVFLTNAVLIYSPSQLALAAIIHATRP